MKATWPQRSLLIVSISPHHLEGELLLIIGDLNREVHLPRNGLTSHPHIHVVSTKAGMSYLQESKNTTAFCRNMFSKVHVLIHTCVIIVHDMIMLKKCCSSMPQLVQYVQKKQSQHPWIFLQAIPVRTRASVSPGSAQAMHSWWFEH